MMDICDDNQHEINHESDVTNLKEYMKVCLILIYFQEIQL